MTRESQNRPKHLLTSALLNAMLFIGMPVGAIILLGVVSAIFRNYNLALSYGIFWAPANSGLADHMEYLFSIGAILGLLCFAFLLLLQKRKQWPIFGVWIIAVVAEIVLLLCAIYSKHTGEPYDLRLFAAGIGQLFVLAPILVGYGWLGIKQSVRHRDKLKDVH